MATSELSARAGSSCKLSRFLHFGGSCWLGKNKGFGLLDVYFSQLFCHSFKKWMCSVLEFWNPAER